MLMVQGVSAEDLRIIGRQKLCDHVALGRGHYDHAPDDPVRENKELVTAVSAEPGIVPVTEIEVLNAIGNPNTILVDMRTEEWFLDATIPGSVNIPYTEVASAEWMNWVAAKTRDGTVATRRMWSAFVMARSARRALPR